MGSKTKLNDPWSIISRTRSKEQVEFAHTGSLKEEDWQHMEWKLAYYYTGVGAEYGPDTNQ
jgi:hypothetical protein